MITFYINYCSLTNLWNIGYFNYVHVANGASGTFTSQDGKTITVANGIITNIA